MAYYLTDDEVAELWDRYSRGETSNALARRFGAVSVIAIGGRQGTFGRS